MRFRRRRVTVAMAATALGALLAGPQLTPMTGAASPLVPPSNVGSGAVDMAVNFSQPVPTFNPGDPLACSTVAFTFGGSLTGVAVNTVGSQFVGVANNVTGSGGNTCAQTFDEVLGVPTFTINAFSATYAISPVGSSSIACSQLTGAYLRVGTHLHIELGNGSCNINQTVTGLITFVSEGEFIPAVPSEVPTTPLCTVVPCGGGDGGNTPISSGTFLGSWTMELAQSH